MAIIGFILGSSFGLALALIGWLGFDLPLLSAFGLYMASGIGFGLLGGLAQMGDDDGEPRPQPVRA